MNKGVQILFTNLIDKQIVLNFKPSESTSINNNTRYLTGKKNLSKP